MTTNRINVGLRQLNTLFDLGQVGGMSDHELLEWFEVHHARAQPVFEELIARHGGMVLDVCRRILRDSHDVDDAYQATFLVLARRAGTIRNRDALGGWLHRVAVRIALRLKAEAARRLDAERHADAAESVESISRELERSEILAIIHEELDRLPASHRAALVACHLEGLTHQEAADRLGWPVGTVRSRLARGRDRLRGRLARRGLTPVVAMAAFAAPTEAAPASFQTLAIRAMGTRVGGTASARAAALAQQAVQAMNLKWMGLCAALVLTVATVAGLAPLGMSRASHRIVDAAEARVEPSMLAGRLSGIVGDAEHHPVAGATVVAGSTSGETNHQITTTGGDGRFSLTWNADARRPDYVIAYKEGLAPASTRRLRMLSRDPVPSYQTELRLDRPGAFVGKAQESNGRPIVGARARLLYMQSPRAFDLHEISANVVRGTPLEALFNTVSDEQGIFRFPAVPAPQRVMVEVKRDGYGDVITEIPGFHWPGLFAASGDSPVPFRMYPEARVVGRVVTRMPGVSVEGLKIGLQSTVSLPFWRESRTDAEGRFEFRGLPKVDVDIYPHDHPSDGPWTYRAVHNLALRPGETVEATLELIEGCLADGQVVDVETKRPIPGASVVEYGPARPGRGGGMLGAKTDDEGRYRLRLPPGENRLQAQYPRPGVSAVNVEIEIPNDAKTLAVPLLRLGDAPPEQPSPFDVIDP